MRKHHNTIYCHMVSIIVTAYTFHNGKCAIHWHLGVLEPFTAALLAIKF